MEPRESYERIILASALAFSGLIPNSRLLPNLPKTTQKESIYYRGSGTLRESINDPFITCREEIGNDLEDIEEPYSYERLEIKELEHFELDSVELIKKDSVVTIIEETPIYLIPFDTKLSKEVKETSLLPGMSGQIVQKRIITNNTGDTIEIGILANTYGGPYVAGIVLSAKFDGKAKNFVISNKSEKSISTYIGTENDLYPNKLANILRALYNISKYQEENGPFKYGEDYSLIKLLGLDDNQKLHEYKSGFASGGGSFLAGGVCASVTGISTLFSNLEDQIVVKERYLHSRPYIQGPFSPSYLDADATVFIHSSPALLRDFVWSVKKPSARKYLKFDVDFLSSGINYDSDNYWGLHGPSDAVIFVSFSLVNEKPEYQKELLEYYIREYDLYRSSSFKNILPGSIRAIKYQKYPVDMKMTNLSKLIYNPDQKSDR